MFHQQSHQPRHHIRFYIFMITLIVGGVFFLLFINNDYKGTSITNAIVGSLNEQDNPQNLSVEIKENELSGKDDFENLMNKDLDQSPHTVPLVLTFDQTLNVKKDAKIGNIELQFDDLTTTITVNGDKLELNNLKEVSLVIKGFSGEVDFEGNDLSMDGKAKMIEVNGMTFSSEKEMEISFDNLNYQHLKVSNLELKDLELEKGNGDLTIGEKLQYSLEGDGISIFYFQGSVEVNKDFNSSSLLSLEGDARGISISGMMMNLNLG